MPRTPIRNEHPRRQRRAAALMVTAVLAVTGASPAKATLTTPSCLAKKIKEWGKLRKCQAIENGKVLQGKTADPAKCQTRFDDHLARLNRTLAGTMSCRYDLNGDGTVTDYDTGLGWEQKTDDGSVHDKDDAYTWSNASNALPSGTAFTNFLGTLNLGTTGFPTEPTLGCFAEQCDWRLPAIEELREIADANQGSCGGGSGACIDQSVFGPTLPGLYSSATSTPEPVAGGVYAISFSDGGVWLGGGADSSYVRAVRSGL